MAEAKRVLVLLNTELGWDNIVCIADSLEAMAFDQEHESVVSLQKMVDDNDSMHITWEMAVTLPEDTLEASIKRYWH